MFDQDITPAEYQYLSDSRAQMALALLIEALQDQMPEGYALSTNPDLMAANVVLAIRPVRTAPGAKMISFIHDITYWSNVTGEGITYRPSTERLRACGSVAAPDGWRTDPSFGDEGQIATTFAEVGELRAMVRLVAAQVSSNAPLTSFEWRRCAHDEVGKWELFNRDRCLQSVWKSGGRYGTLMGTTPKTLVEAKQEAEISARFMLSSEHQQRLAGLGEEPLPELNQDEDPEGEAPAM